MAIGSGTFSNLGGGVSDIFSYLSTGYKEKALQFEEQNYEAAAGFALQNKEFTRQSTDIKEQQASRELYSSLGKTETAVAGAGFTESGSALDILRSSASQGAMTKAVINAQGLITEAGYQQQHDAYMNMAEASKAAQAGLKLSGIGSLIGAGFKFLAAGMSFIPSGGGGGGGEGE